MFEALDERVRVLPDDLPLVNEVGRDYGVEFLVPDEE